MKTNDYLDRYMNLQALDKRISSGISDLCYRNKIYDVGIQPNHFNYFSLVLSVKSSEVSLPIKDARELAQFILDSTEGLENTHDIMEEIRKRAK